MNADRPTDWVLRGAPAGSLAVVPGDGFLPLRFLGSRIVLLYSMAVLFFGLTGLDSYLGASGILPFPPALIPVFGLLPLFLGIFVFGSPALQRQVAWTFHASRAVVLSVLAISVLALVYALIPNSYFEIDQKIIFRPIYMFFLLIFSLAIISIPVIRENCRWVFVVAFIGLTLSIVGRIGLSGEIEAGTFRESGFSRNPNEAAFQLILLCIAALEWRRPRVTNLGILGIGGYGVLATLSRGGMAMFILVCGSYFVSVLFSGKRGKGFLVLMTFFACAAVLFVKGDAILRFYQRSDYFGSVTAQERFREVFSALQGRVGWVDKTSRTVLLKEHMALIGQAPLFGHGSGLVDKRAFDDGKKGPHNILLNQWVENGILGLGAILFFFFFLFLHFRRTTETRGKVFTAILFTQGLLSHNLLENKPVMIMTGLLLGLALQQNRQPKRLEASPVLSNAFPVPGHR